MSNPPSALVHISFGKNSWLYFVTDQECEDSIGIRVPDLISALRSNAFKVTDPGDPHYAWEAFARQDNA
jgi:hypothetical protein